MHDIRPYLPELFNEPGTLLYIGARADAHSWLDELIEAGNEVYVLEVWEPNVQGLIRSDLKIRDIFLGNVKDIDDSDAWISASFYGKFDYIFYWHGPEHLEAQEIAQTLDKLFEKTNKTLAIACPYGKYHQGAHTGNPYETHKSTLYPDFFKRLGFTVATDGEADKAGSEIVAWKIK